MDYDHSLQQALHENEEGIRMLETECFEQAAKCFADGLRCCQLILRHLIDLDQEGEDTFDDDSLCLDFCMEAESYHHLLRRGSYRQPIAVPDLYRRKYLADDNFPSVAKHLSIILIFNQALVHEQWQWTDDRPPQAVDTACRLYECAVKIVYQEELWSTSTSFLMACYNNMGQIYKHLNKTQNSNDCFERLLTTLMLLVDSKHPSASDEFRIYFKNISHLMLSVDPPAPAA